MIKTFSGSEPYLIAADNPAYIAATKAIETVFHKTPVPVRDGGSLPLCDILERELGVKSVLLGFGLPDDNVHSVDENFDIGNYFKGIETILNFHHYYARLVKMQG